VTAIGSGKAVSVGDTVLVDRLVGTSIEEGQDKYLILKEDEILGIL